MTMISFRADDADAAAVDVWARRLHIGRSEFLRQALRRHLADLAAEKEVRAYADQPPTGDENALAAVANWGPSEEWADWVNWADAPR